MCGCVGMWCVLVCVGVCYGCVKLIGSRGVCCVWLCVGMCSHAHPMSVTKLPPVTTLHAHARLVVTELAHALVLILPAHAHTPALLYSACSRSQSCLAILSCSRSCLATVHAHAASQSCMKAVTLQACCVNACLSGIHGSLKLCSNKACYAGVRCGGK